jgi:hypothetical protein
VNKAFVPSPLSLVPGTLLLAVLIAAQKIFVWLAS